MEAANWAPTHAKNEPWRYAIFEGPESIHGYFDFLESWYENHADEISEKDLRKFKRKLYRYTLFEILIFCPKIQL